MKKFPFLACLTGLLLTCCVLNAKSESARIDEQSIPTAWNNEVDTLFMYQQPLEQQWWLRFNDATLNQLVDEVLKNNYDLKQAA